jgi:phosphodiesterase/alkaline phosphatase D-like protein
MIKPLRFGVGLWISAATATVWLASSLAGGSRDLDVRWVWSGGVTTSSAVVKTGVSNPEGDIRLTVSRRADFVDSFIVPRGEPARLDSPGVATFKLDGLESDTVHHFAVETGRGRGLEGRFRTFRDGPMSFRAAFGSCASTGSNHRVFSTILGFDPLFFIHMGDFHYENIRVNRPSVYRAAFEKVLASRRQSALYRSVPIAYVWDDHDFGPNDSDRTAPGRPAALSVYREYVPHYPLSSTDGKVETIQQAFTAGRIRFILTDVRASRDPEDRADGPDKSMLGTAQRKWLFDQLADAGGYPLVVWVNVVPWITRDREENGHGWAPYHWERTLIADRIKASNLVDRLLILSGDGHMVAIDDGSNSNYATDREPGERGFPVMHAAPLDRYPRIKGGPYSQGTAPRRVNPLFGWIKTQQFGLMEVEDDGRVLRVTLTGRDSRGEQLDGMRLTIRCEADGCRVVD